MNALDDMTETHLTDVRVKKQANWHIYEQKLEAVAGHTQCSVQMVQDVVHQISVECGERPAIITELVCDFLETLAQYQQHEKKEEKP